jgi:hypothetical protein
MSIARWGYGKIEAAVNKPGLGNVITTKAKVTFSIARNVIMIGLLSKRGDAVRHPLV